MAERRREADWSNMGKVTIRNADLADAAVIAELSGQLGYPDREQAIAERLACILGRKGTAVFVAELDGKVVGWAHAAGQQFIESPPFAELAGLVVDRDARRLGVGSRLVEACAQWARNQGFGQIRVRCNVVREDAHQFYRKVGFAKLKSQIVFRMDLV
jgi:GNAT superfamily N-acetyltransferase